MNRICIEAAFVVTCNEQFDVIPDARIHIKDNRITFVGAHELAPAFEANEIIRGKRLVALPGLVNTHTHSAMTLLRGYADDMALEPWLHQKIWPFEKNLQSEDVYWGTHLAIAEMIRGGSTTFADMYFFYERGLDAIIESGIRACPGGVFLGFLPEAEKRLDKAIAFVKDHQGAASGRVYPFFAPHSLYACTRPQWEKLVAVKIDTKVLLHTHISETQAEVKMVKEHWGDSPVHVLQKIGALESPLMAAHCVQVTPKEIEIMAQTPFAVSHNPTSNMKLASGCAPVPEFLHRGITVGIGTDGVASNNDLDMWEEMRLAALVHKMQNRSPVDVPAEQALLMATREGAKCLGLEKEIGSLEAGKKADITIVDFDAPHLYPLHNVVSHLVYAVHAADVDTVIVDGKVLLRDKKFTGIDSARIAAKVEEAVERLTQS
jgi:5-methylthioadenosine/S-adenosylhomocysteine deaminase